MQSLKTAVLKCTEILNHYVVYQELTQCCRPIVLQKQTNEVIEKEIRFVVTISWGWGKGELDEGSQKVPISIYKINSTRGVMYNMTNISNTAVCYI